MPKRKATNNPPTFSKRQWGRRTVPPSAPAPTPSPRIVIDHLSFPHIMDAIVAAADLAALAKLALTCRKYHDELYVGTHFVVTTTSNDELAFAPFHKPRATRVPELGGGAEWLDGLGVVDLKLRTHKADVMDKLKDLVSPTIVRTLEIAPVKAKVFVFIVNNVARYSAYNGQKKQFVPPNNPIGGWSLSPAQFVEPEKLVMAVRFSCVRPPAFIAWTDLQTTSPVVVHFVNVDDEPSLDTRARRTRRTCTALPVVRGFGADNVYGILQVLVVFTGTTSVTVVGLETISPWTFTSDKEKTRITHLDPDAREQQLRHLLSFRNTRVERLEFVTVNEYAQRVTPAMLALERGEGFPFPS